eukprot:jgi/Chrzof1/9838/Cz04g17280.t1
MLTHSRGSTVTVQTSGVVVFATSEGAAAALQLAGAGQIIEYELPLPAGPVGLKAWVQAHKAQLPGTAQLQKQLDDWMAAYEESEAAARVAREATMTEEGWTVVVRSKGRAKRKESAGGPTMSGGVSLAAATAVAQGQTQGKKHEDFYRFQQRDKRRNELVDLRDKFEEDRKRIAEIRAARNFKPL